MGSNPTRSSKHSLFPSMHKVCSNAVNVRELGSIPRVGANFRRFIMTTMKMSNKWKYFFPEDGETENDARELSRRFGIDYVEDAAWKACELDCSLHNGWSRRGNKKFIISIISPDNIVIPFNAQHESSVEHRVWMKE